MERQQEFNREALSSGQTASLEAQFERIHAHGEEGSWIIGELTKDVNRTVAQAGERLHMNSRAVGGVLMTFGFRNRRRTSKSRMMMWLGRSVEEHIHFLKSVYRIWRSADLLPSRELLHACEFCPDGQDAGMRVLP